MEESFTYLRFSSRDFFFLKKESKNCSYRNGISMNFFLFFKYSLRSLLFCFISGVLHSGETIARFTKCPPPPDVSSTRLAHPELYAVTDCAPHAVLCIPGRCEHFPSILSVCLPARGLTPVDRMSRA